MKHSLLLHPLNLVSLLTRLWLDDIFNLFVQRSLAYWGKKKKRKMTWKKDEPSSKHICVRPCTICCSNLWEHLCLWHEGAFITFLLRAWQQNAGRRISMRRLGNTSLWTSLCGVAKHFQHIHLALWGYSTLASRCTDAALLNAPWCQQRFGLTRGLNRNQPLKP